MNIEWLEPRLLLSLQSAWDYLFASDAGQVASSPSGDADMSDELRALFAEEYGAAGGIATAGALPSYSTLANGMPILHSRSGAAGKIFLDFDGNTGGPTDPYSEDTDTTTFNATEQANIAECWRQMSVYFAMFDLDVTTIQPTVATESTAWEAVGNNIQRGYSYVGVYPNRTQAQSFNSSGDARTRVSGIAHEIGHNLGNSHQSTYDIFGIKTAEYSSGPDELHGPMMGVDYAGVAHKWTWGHPTSSPATLQDDMAIIANRIKQYAPTGYTGDGYAADDYGGTLAMATAMTTSGTTQSVVGVIERLTDADAFSFSITTAGRYSVLAGRDAPSCVDLKLSIYDTAGTLIAAEDGDPRTLPLTMVNDQSISLDLSAGTYYAVVEGHGAYSDQGQYFVRVDAIPTGWTSQDIGVVGVPGYTQYDAATSVFTIAGSGSDIGSTTDRFQFAYQTLQGDGTIIAQVTALQNTNTNAKAGVMIRESLDANAREAAVLLTYGSGKIWTSRSTTGGSATSTSSGSGTYSPTWVKLQRAGSVFTAYNSTDGVVWTQIGTSQTIAMGQTVYIGLATGAVNNVKLNTATLQNVTVTGALNPQPVLNALAAPQDVTVSSPTYNSLRVGWIAVAGATGYKIERSADGVNYTTIVTTASSVTSYTNTGLADGQRYFYRVRAQDASGASVASAVVSGVTRAGVVSGLSATRYSTTALVLNWTDATGETGYRVEMSTNGTDWSSVTTLAANCPSYTATGLAEATKYWFRVVTIDASGDASTSTTLVDATRWSATVTGLTLTSVTSSQVSFAWTDVTGEDDYLVERGNSPTFFSTVATLAAGTTSYTDTGRSALTEYYYRVTPRKQLSGATSYGQFHSSSFAATTAATALPPPWVAKDIGVVAGPGASGYNAGVFTSIAAGAGVTGTKDEFRFLYQGLGGDGTLVIHNGMQEVGDTLPSQSGIMFRSSLADNASYVAALNYYTTKGLSSRFQVREQAGAVTGTTAFATTYRWYRITRAGSLFTVDGSTDGSNWANLGSATIEMGYQIYIGMMVSANNDTQLSTCTFDNVALTHVNQAPTLDNSGDTRLDSIHTLDRLSSGTLVRDLVASIGGSRITDSDSGALAGIAVTAVDNASGDWQYSTDDAATWASFGTVAANTARLLGIDNATRVRFVPSIGYVGTVATGTTFRAWDQTSGENGGLGDVSTTGGATAFSSAVETASVTVVNGPFGHLVTPTPGSATQIDLGYFDVQWQDTTGSGLNTGTIDVADITVAGVTVNSVENLGSSVWRYSYTGHVASGMVRVYFVAGQVLAIDGTAMVGRWDAFTFDGPPVVASYVAPTSEGSTSAGIIFSEAVTGGSFVGNYRLQWAGSDGLLGTADDRELPISASYAGTTATIAFAGLRGGLYRLTARDQIRDAQANQLDGDGDCLAGGDWYCDFVVTEGKGVQFGPAQTMLYGPGNSDARAVLVQPDGKIVFGGRAYTSSSDDFVLARANPDGTLDTSFDGDGRVDVGFTAFSTDQLYALALQPDGKIVAAGYFSGDVAVARFNPDGSLDTSFGGDGRATVSAGANTSDYGYAVALQSDGKIVVVGYTWANSAFDTFVVRWNSDGSLDNSFDSDGTLTLSLFAAGTEYAYGVAIQSDGKIVIAGYGGTTSQFSLVRLDSDGALDTSFDGDGMLTTAIAGSSCAQGLALQGDGKIVVAGYANYDFALVRYNSDGSLDSNFDSDGKLTIPMSGSNDYASAVALQSDGKIVVTGYAWSGTSYDLAVARVNATGSLDPTFDGDGKATIAVGGGNDYGYALALQPDGKMLVAGYAVSGSRNDAIVVRLASTGTLDNGFDGDGKLFVAQGFSSEDAYGVAIQPDGKIVACGSSSPGSNSDFTVLRCEVDGSPDATFGGTGAVTTPIGTSSDNARAVLLQPDGRIVVAGMSAAGSSGFGVVRYNTNGSLDTTFDSDGKVQTAIGSQAVSVFGAALQSDDRIVVVGHVHDGTQFDVAAVRYNSNGSLDTTFDGDGKLIAALSTGSDYAYAVAVQSDGKIVVGGSVPGASGNNAALVRFNANGSLDTTFDSDGKLTTTFGLTSSIEGRAVAIQSDGKIVLAGYGSNGSQTVMGVARFNADGSLDTTFDADGFKSISFAEGATYGYAIVLQSDGKIVVGGYCGGGGTEDCAVARLNGDGSLDTSFDGDGKLLFSLGGGADRIYSMAIGADGRIAVTGQTVDAGDARAFAGYLSLLAPSTALSAPGGTSFTIDTAQWGGGQLMGAGGSLDGAGRLRVGGSDYIVFDPTTSADSGRTVVTPSIAQGSLSVSREVTVPHSGGQDFARTVDVFTNGTGATINTTVTIVGNLGSDGATTVFATADGDTTPEVVDGWIGTDDADGSGTPAVIHYIHGPKGLRPASVSVVGDNVIWTYDVSVAAGQTVRLAHYTIVADSRAAAIAAAGALVQGNGFGGQAGAFLTQDELASLANFQFATAPIDIALSNAAVKERQPVGTVVGQLSTTDADSGDTFTYRLPSDAGYADNSLFTISVSGQLQTAAAFDFVAKPSYTVLVESTDSYGLSFTKTFVISVINVAPTLDVAYLGGSQWKPATLQAMAAAGAGDMGLGIQLVDGTSQLANSSTIVLSKPDQLTLRFNEAVNVTQSSLVLYNSLNQVVNSTGFTKIDNRTAQWTFAPLAANKYWFQVVAANTTDAGGLTLDGEWTTSSTTYATSGNGQAGGDLNFRFNVLAGDANGDGTVNVSDVLYLRPRLGAPLGATNWKTDLNASGGINTSDVISLRSWLGVSLGNFSEPTLPPAGGASLMGLALESETASVPTDLASTFESNAVVVTAAPTIATPSPVLTVAPAAVTESVSPTTSTAATAATEPAAAVVLLSPTPVAVSASREPDALRATTSASEPLVIAAPLVEVAPASDSAASIEPLQSMPVAEPLPEAARLAWRAATDMAFADLAAAAYAPAASVDLGWVEPSNIAQDLLPNGRWTYPTLRFARKSGC